VYPNSALSAGAVIAMVATVVVTMFIWLGAVFLAAREPRHHGPDDHGD